MSRRRTADTVTLPLLAQDRRADISADESGRPRMASPAALADVRHRGGMEDLRPAAAKTVGQPANRARCSHIRPALNRTSNQTTQPWRFCSKSQCLWFFSRRWTPGRSGRRPPESDRRSRATACWGDGSSSAACVKTWKTLTGSSIRSPGRERLRRTTASRSTTAPRTSPATSSRCGSSHACTTSQCLRLPSLSLATSASRSERPLIFAPGGRRTPFSRACTGQAGSRLDFA